MKKSIILGILLIISFLIIPVFSTETNASRSVIEGDNGLQMFLEGDKGDTISIDFKYSSHPVYIWILDRENYKGWFTDEPFSIEWKVDNVSEGYWEWELKTRSSTTDLFSDLWILMIHNPTSDDIIVNIDVENIDSADGLFDNISQKWLFNTVIGCFLVFILLIALIIAPIYLIKKRKKEELPKFIRVDDQISNNNIHKTEYKPKPCPSCGTLLEFEQLPMRCPFCESDLT